MEYITKNFHQLFNTLPNMNCSYQKPAICPHCGINCDSVHINQHCYTKDNNLYFVFLILQCTACSMLFTATYKIENCHSELYAIAPKTTSTFKDKLIEQTSPRFVEMYNQALRAKENGDLNLAAIGYRSALEILVKDYAINELHEPSDKVINKKLFPAISAYMPANSLIKTADVVRILGNDHTHYERKYPELDFQLLQEYMEIFISLVRGRLLIAHPPVSR